MVVWLATDVILKVVFMDQSAMRISLRSRCVRVYFCNGGCKGRATNTLLVQLLNSTFLCKNDAGSSKCNEKYRIYIVQRVCSCVKTIALESAGTWPPACPSLTESFKP